MVFEGLANKLQDTFKRLKGKGKLSEKDIKVAMREVKLALLEADVNFKVVKHFIKNVSEKAIGEEVMTSLTPGQQVIKIVNEELTELMGSKQSKLDLSAKPPIIIMLTGLQGTGKTTACGKLGLYLRKQNKRPLLTACDVYRPAAVDQLKVIGKQVDLPVFSMGTNINPVDIAKAAVKHAEKHGNDVVILDTAGRLHIDEELMDELSRIKKNVVPNEVLLVVDAMIGQDAVNVAKEFNEKLEIDGIILTKLDGDTRGGAALSVKSVTGKPIKFIGVGEKVNDLEPFFPDRMASRILGMGDVLSLIDKAQEAFDEQKALEMERKLRKQQFTFDDFLDQLEQLRNMGPMNQILGMMPGVNNKMLKGMDVDEKKLDHIEAIIKSMTKEERNNPSIINSSRKIRIADGSGTKVQEINSLLKQYNQMKKLMKQFNNPKKMKKMKNMFPNM